MSCTRELRGVRLSPEFRFEGDEGEIRRAGDAVILGPVRRRDWPPGYWAWLEANQDELELADVDALGGGLLDVE